MLRPNEVSDYLDKVRPSLTEIKCTARVDVVGVGKYLYVIATDILSCLVCVQFSDGDHRWIRIEQIEYIHPY